MATESKHTSLCGTPSEKVSIIIDNEEFYIDLFESMTTGKLHFVHAFMYSEEDNVG
jgi:hypothetical protein